MDPTKPEDCAELDLRPVLKAVYPSYGPDWDRAIEMGIDVGQLEANLALTVQQRIEQLHEMTKLYELFRPRSEQP